MLPRDNLAKIDTIPFEIWYSTMMGCCPYPGGTLFSAAVLRSCGVAVGKGALSANDIFSTTTSWEPERLQTQFWTEDGSIAGIVEKIWLSREERLFRRAWVISGAEENSGNSPIRFDEESALA
jgi:hypothetical protein